MNDLGLGKGAKAQTRSRGEQPTHIYQCQSLEDLLSALQAHVQAVAVSLIPELMYYQFTFNDATVFAIESESSIPNGAIAQVQTTVPGAVAGSADAKEKHKRQRRVARHILDGIQHIDGYSYFERKVWDTKDLDGFRFSNNCKDSLQNRDRKANNPERAKRLSKHPSRNPVDSTNMEEAQDGDKTHASALPTFDCKGHVMIKFLASKQCIEVVYRHLPIHRDVAERSGPGERRKAEDSLSIVDSPLPESNDQQAAAPEKPKKKRRKKAADTPPTTDGDPITNSSGMQNDTSGSNGFQPTYEIHTIDSHSDELNAAGRPKIARKGPPQPSKRGTNTKRSDAQKRRSKAGCMTCRVRKIKCDERRPVCGQCAIKDRECSYPTPADAAGVHADSASLGAMTAGEVI